MKLAFVSSHDAANVRSWSGTPYHMCRALAQQAVEVELVAPLRRTRRWLLLTKKIYYGKLQHTRYLTDREPSLARGFARQVAARLKHLDVDAILSDSTIPIAYLKTKQPVAFWADSTFAGNFNFYPEFSNLCQESERNGHFIESAAIHSASAAIYSSEWAANSAIESYQAAGSRVHVVPFGANIESQPPADEVRRSIEARAVDTCRLLFLGVDWERKGGDVAVEIAGELNARGVRCELTVIGCEPRVDGPLPSFVRNRGFVSKATQSGRAELAQVMSESHFLLLPTRADDTPIVICEANAMGVPCVATRVGGIPTMVRDGVSGMTFDVDASPAAYARAIEDAFTDKRTYQRLALAALAEYHARLNWSTSAESVVSILRRLVDCSTD